MYARIVQLLALAALALGVYSLNPLSARAGGPASSNAARAATPAGAVLRVIRPFYDRSAQGALCNAVEGKLAACPLTSRLRNALARELRWERQHTRGGNGNPFCRCQNTPTRVVVSGVLNYGATADVSTIWYYGPTNLLRLSFFVRRLAGGWLVDDNFCTGYPSKNMYHIPIGPCP